jgi:2-methylisocitrate lyase-like PEP mutase family enzyme
MRAIAANIYLSANRRARIQAQFVTARAPRRTQTLAKSPRAVVNIGSRVTGAENRAGVAGIRIDDQPIEGKRKTQSAGVDVVPLHQAIARYRAAVDMKNELDPNFVIMAQCYARDAGNGTLEDTIARLRAYREQAGVDWVQFESPHSIEEIRAARAAVPGPFSFMKGKLDRYLDLDEHLALGVTIAWYPGFTHHVTWAALWDFMTAFKSGGVKAWDAFIESRQDRPYPTPEVPDHGESGAKQRALEQRYFSSADPHR